MEYEIGESKIMFHEIRVQTKYLGIRVTALGNSFRFRHWHWMQHFIHRQNVFKTCSMNQEMSLWWVMNVNKWKWDPHHTLTISRLFDGQTRKWIKNSWNNEFAIQRRNINMACCKLLTSVKERERNVRNKYQLDCRLFLIPSKEFPELLVPMTMCFKVRVGLHFQQMNQFNF